MANNSDVAQPDVFQRLVGLETEYALHLPARRGARKPNRYAIFRGILAAVRQKIPCATARSMKEGAFHAAGGAIWFETERPASGGGLIEGSTPECRTPRQLITWQRAQDQLLAEAAESAFGSSVRLLKNDRDAYGNVYGAQENYEATLAEGWRLAVWRTALVLLLPLAALTWLALWAIDKLVECYALFAAMIFLAVERVLPRPERLARLLFGCDVKDLSTDVPVGPRWLESLLTVVVRALTMPLAVPLVAVLWLVAFVRIRRELTPFLISRAVIAGAGSLTGHGEFLLAGKASAVNCLVGLGGFWRDRPMYCFGHFFKLVYAEAWLAPQQYWRLFHRRQRLQISLGDSNLADTAEYLRVATTMLVLDAIEAGQMPRVPAIPRPIAALHALSGDSTLRARIQVGSGSASALEIQRFYLAACRRFLNRRPDAPADAREALTRWEDTLDSLAEDPESLIGVLDWVSKRFLLDQADAKTRWPARKKIDLRYHELSPDGYFHRLREAGVVLDLLRPAEIEHARRNPPTGTPAAVRGRYIREFATEGEDVSVNWQAVYLNGSDTNRVIRLDRLSPKSKNQRAVRKPNVRHHEPDET